MSGAFHINLKDFLDGGCEELSLADLYDDDDFEKDGSYKYIKSFDANNESIHYQAKNFIDRYGFVVFGNVFNPQEVDDTQNAMWSIVESYYPGLKRDDPSTWSLYKSTGKYGLSSRGPSFDPTLVNNRQNPVLAAALATVLNTTIDDVMVSHDRFTVYRATGLDEEEYEREKDAQEKKGGREESAGTIADSDAEADTVLKEKARTVTGTGTGTALATGKRNIHLDLNPWWWQEGSRDVLIGADRLTYSTAEDLVRENNLVVNTMGEHVQCVMNFVDNHVEDGGTLVVPGFHRVIQQWCAHHGQMAVKGSSKGNGLRRNVPFVTFNSCSETEDNAEQALLARSIRVTMRAGSVLMWKQTLAHGTQPNASRVCRLAQFLKAFSRKSAFEDVGAYPPAQAQEDTATETHAIELSKAPEEQEQEQEQKSNSETKNKSKNMGKGKGNAKSTTKDVQVDKYSTWSWNGSARLVRRAQRIHSDLVSSAALSCVTPLGRRLFGLDVIELPLSLPSPALEK